MCLKNLMVYIKKYKKRNKIHSNKKQLRKQKIKTIILFKTHEMKKYKENRNKNGRNRSKSISNSNI